MYSSELYKDDMTRFVDYFVKQVVKCGFCEKLYDRAARRGRSSRGYVECYFNYVKNDRANFLFERGITQTPWPIEGAAASARKAEAAEARELSTTSCDLAANANACGDGREKTPSHEKLHQSPY